MPNLSYPTNCSELCLFRNFLCINTGISHTVHLYTQWSRYPNFSAEDFIKCLRWTQCEIDLLISLCLLFSNHVKMSFFFEINTFFFNILTIAFHTRLVSISETLFPVKPSSWAPNAWNVTDIVFQCLVVSLCLFFFACHCPTPHKNRMKNT